MIEPSKLLAFLRRDWALYCRRPFDVAASLAYVTYSCASFYFISLLVDPQASATLASYRSGYFPFVLLGLVVSQYVQAALSSVPARVREEQLFGSLEAMLASPTRVVTILVGVSMWSYIWATIQAVGYLLVGVVIFRLDLSHMNVAATLVLAVLVGMVFSGLGVLATSVALVWKDTNPINWILGGVMKLVSGVFVPVAVLPGSLQVLARWMPLTYALEGFRRAILAGTSLHELLPACTVLGLFAVVLWPLAVISVTSTLTHLKLTGRLSFR